MSMQPYMVLLDGIVVPVTPQQIKIKRNGKNKVVELIDGTSINRLNKPGLESIKFKLLLPKDINLPFVNKILDINTQSKVSPPKQDTYIRQIKALQKKPFLFIIWRTDIGGSRDMGTEEGERACGDGIITHKSVTLESYEFDEDANNGLDIYVEIELQEYIGYGTQKVVITQKDDKNDKTTVASTETKNDVKKEAATNKEIPKTYTVKKNDFLIKIAKKELGDDKKWRDIYELNKDIISNPNKIYPGQVLNLPTE